MVKYADSMLKLQELLENKAAAWRTGPLVIVISIATSLTNDKQIELDFATTIGYNNFKPRKPSDGNCYWLPAHLNENTDDYRAGADYIHPIFVQACYRAGFNIKANWKKDDDCILFSCNRDRFHNEDKNKDYFAKQTCNVKDKSKPPVPRDRKTVRPIKEKDEETCKFSFRVYWDDSKKRWFLPHQQSGSLMHCGHSHFDSKYLRIERKHGLSQDEQNLATDCFQTKNSTTATANLLNYWNAIGLEWHQLHYLKTKKKNDLVIRGMDPDDVSNTAEISAADRTLALLKSKPNVNVSYTALIAELESGLLTLKRRKKGINNSITIEEFTKDLDGGIDRPEGPPA
eukprot:scaffold11426_cov78-Skeletonema_dohrnii-CCMP3373.AAC.2